MKQNFLLLIIIMGFTFLLLSGCDKEEPEHYSSNFPASSIELKERIQMPVFELPSATGDILHSKSLQSKTLLVIFFQPACQNCYGFLAGMEKLQNAYTEKGFTVVAIASGRITSNQLSGIYKKINTSYPLLTDTEASLHKKFGMNIIMPVTYLVTNKGTIVKKYLGHPDRQMLAVDIEKMF